MSPPGHDEGRLPGRSATVSSSTSIPTVADAALAYADRGWHVFPLGSNKKPRIPKAAGGNGFHDATTDPEQITQWWQQYPRAGIGIATGVSGLLVIDVDAYKPGAYDALLDLEHEHGPWKVTAAAVTARGGFHFYFTAPADAGIGCSSSKLGFGIDVKGEGGYAVGPPSYSGGYRWSKHGLRWDATLPEPPAGIVDALRRPPRVEAPAEGGSHWPAVYGGADAYNRLRGLLQAVLDAPEGKRNEVLHWAACRAGETVRAGQLDQRIAYEALARTGLAAGLEPREVEGCNGVGGTVRSGLGRTGVSSR